jgi:hypothetical protein
MQAGEGEPCAHILVPAIRPLLHQELESTAMRRARWAALVGEDACRAPPAAVVATAAPAFAVRIVPAASGNGVDDGVGGGVLLGSAAVPKPEVTAECLTPPARSTPPRFAEGPSAPAPQQLNGCSHSASDPPGQPDAAPTSLQQAQAGTTKRLAISDCLDARPAHSNGVATEAAGRAASVPVLGRLTRSRSREVASLAAAAKKARVSSPQRMQDVPCAPDAAEPGGSVGVCKPSSEQMDTPFASAPKKSVHVPGPGGTARASESSGRVDKTAAGVDAAASPAPVEGPSAKHGTICPAPRNGMLPASGHGASSDSQSAAGQLPTKELPAANVSSLGTATATHVVCSPLSASVLWCAAAEPHTAVLPGEDCVVRALHVSLLSQWAVNAGTSEDVQPGVLHMLWRQADVAEAVLAARSLHRLAVLQSVHWQLALYMPASCCGSGLGPAGLAPSHACVCLSTDVPCRP